MPASSIFFRTGLKVASVADARQSLHRLRRRVARRHLLRRRRRAAAPAAAAAAAAPRGIPASASAWFDISSISPRPIVM